MIKNALAITGSLLILAGVFLGGYLLLSATQAQALDSSQYGQIAAGLCDHPRPVIELAKRTMAENDSQALRVRFSNISNEMCIVNATLDAPNFDIGTLGATRSVSLPPLSTTTELIWVISPKRTGTFQITVQSEQDSDVIGVTVLNVLGFSPWQVQAFSVISTFLGPMLTAPWWYEQWKARQTKKRR